MRWDLFDQCVKWAGVLYDEDARRDVALQVLEEVGDKPLADAEIKHRVRWRALNELKRIQQRVPTNGGDALAWLDECGDSGLETATDQHEPSPEDTLVAKRRRQQLCDAIGTAEVEFLELSSEFTDKELARETGESEANLRKRRSRLRRKAKEIL